MGSFISRPVMIADAFVTPAGVEVTVGVQVAFRGFPLRLAVRQTLPGWASVSLISAAALQELLAPLLPSWFSPPADELTWESYRSWDAV